MHSSVLLCRLVCGAIGSSSLEQAYDYHGIFGQAEFRRASSPNSASWALDRNDYELPTNVIDHDDVDR